MEVVVIEKILVPKLKSVTQNEWKKHPYIIFLLLVQKKPSLSGKNWKGFCVKINCSQMKLLNLENWTDVEPQYLAKIRDFKVDYFILPLFLVPKLKSVTQN